MKRRTVTFSDSLYAEIQRLRGKRIAESGKGLPFSRIVEELVKEGLQKADK